MCGRTSLFVSLEDLEGRLEATHVAPNDYEPRYNIAPSNPLEIVTAENDDSILRFTWGIVPFWADNPDDAGWINARSETADTKSGFRASWKERPCLVPSTGFYEWQDSGHGRKQPYRIHRPNDLFMMAGIWDCWEADDETDDLYSVAILTTEANDLVSPIHDRMPVILRQDDESKWLNGDPEVRKSLCQPYPGDDLDAYTISTEVNNPANDSPSVINSLGTEQSGLDSFS